MKLITLLFLTALSAQATIIGLSTHPFAQDTKVITTEFTSFLSNGTGAGIAARYYQKVADKLNFDAGIGLSSGERENRLFVGLDYEIFPDYGRQPRFSIKGMAETLSFDGDRINTFAIAPTISKGFIFNSREAFPFLSLPLTTALNTDDGSYETQSALGAGITSRFKFNGSRELIANVETNIGLRSSYTSLILGVSMPLL